MARRIPAASLRTLTVALAGLVLMATVRTFAVLEYRGAWGAAVVSNLAEALLATAAALSLIFAAVAHRRAGKGGRCWLLLGLGLCLYAAGDYVWTWLIITRSGVPYPGVSDYLYFVSYLLLGAGLIGSLWAFRDLVDVRPAIGIGITAGVVLFGLISVAALDPAVLSGEGVPLLERVVSTAYIFADVFVLMVPGAVIAIVLFRLNAPELALPWLFVALGCTLLATADTFFAVQSASNSYASGSGLLDYGWMAGNLAFTLAGSIAIDTLHFQPSPVRGPDPGSVLPAQQRHSDIVT